jgi:DNA-binding response OmpR family regulator
MSAQSSIYIRSAYRPELVVLVVEDSMLFSKDIKHSLPEHRVILTRSVEEAKLSYDEHLPNIVFLDIDLPDGTGFEVLDYIREKEPEAFIVMLTGSKVESDVIMSKVDQHLGEYFEYREKLIKAQLLKSQQHRRGELLLAPHMIVT